MHILKLITFFSIIVLLCIVPIFSQRVRQQGKTGKPFILPRQIKSNTGLFSEKMSDLQIINSASKAGTILCTKEDPGICQPSQEGNVLEYNTGCSGSNAVSSRYICKRGRWTYVDWTDHAFCQFCKGK